MHEYETDFSFLCGEEDAGKRLDVFLSGEMSEFSRNHIQKLIGEGRALVNGLPQKANFRLKTGDVTVISVPVPEAVAILPEDIPLDIVYEDNDLIVVNKPKGMVVHPAAGHFSGTLVNALLFHCQSSLSGINGELRPGIVHRIDRDTSGLLVAAKNDAAHLYLSRQLAEHSMTREYRAIVCGGFSQEEGAIDKPIGRHPQDRKKMAVVANGRRAVTHYQVLERLGQYTLLSLRLETGRTHQIRVHMAALNHPLLGDVVYGREKQPYQTQGQALHAGILGFLHPATHAYMEFSAEPPLYFAEVLEKLRRGS